MGDPLDFGGMRHEQASREMFDAGDAGRPTLPAGDVAFIPLQVQEEAEGYQLGAGLNEPHGSPALFTIRHFKAGQRFNVDLPWRAGVSVKYYLQKAGLVGTRLRTALKINGRNVRMSHIPKPQDVLIMSAVARPMS